MELRNKRLRWDFLWGTEAHSLIVLGGGGVIVISFCFGFALSVTYG